MICSCYEECYVLFQKNAMFPFFIENAKASFKKNHMFFYFRKRTLMIMETAHQTEKRKGITVLPHRSRALKLAPCFKSNSTTSEWPSQEAT